MRLTRATNYAVRALVALARRREDERAELRSLAREISVPEAFLGKILGGLARAGLVHARRGRRGGYRLARRAREITLREVVEVFEGRVSFARCLGRRESCSRAGRCPARRTWARLQSQLNSALESETIGDVVPGGVA